MSEFWTEVADGLDANRAANAYLFDCAGWVDEYVKFADGEGLAPYQREILEAVGTHRRVSARGPHGLGKTALSALIVLWFVLTRQAAGINWKAVTTSGSWFQLATFLWPEIHIWVDRLDWEKLGQTRWTPHEELLNTAIKLGAYSVTAASPERPAMIEGGHADHILILADESKIISPEVFNAIEGAFSNVGSDTGKVGIAVAVSTPGPPMGRFFQIQSRKPGYDDWWVRHVTLDEAVAAGRVSYEWAQKRAQQWGQDSAEYQNRVLGEFAADDENAVIPSAWIDAAVLRWHQYRNDPNMMPPPGTMFGVDVARQGKDQTVIATRRGDWLLESVHYEPHTNNLVDLGDRVAEQMRAANARTAVVDMDGMGAGVGDRITQLGLTLTEFWGGQRAETWRDRSGRLEAFNRRSAAWWNMRELLDPAFGSRIALPPDEKLLTGLGAPQRVADPQYGRIRVEQKADTKKRLGESPDCLVAGTMIRTPTGQKPIEQLTIGDSVCAPWGNTTVFATIEQQVTETVALTLADGRTIEGKPNHATFSPAKGWIKLGDTLVGDTLVYESWLYRRLLAALKPSNTTAANIGFKRATQQMGAASTTSQATNANTKAPAHRYTGKSSKTIKARSQTATTYTTWTTTLSTITPTTSQRYRPPNIWPNTHENECKTPPPTPKQSKGLRKGNRPLKIGTLPQKVWHGIAETVKRYGQTKRENNAPIKPSVSYAGKRSPHIMPTPDFARPTVGSAALKGLADTTRFPRLANIAVRTFLRIGTGRRGSVVVAVQRNTGNRRSVYDLVLTEHNAYWANGVLVENCADAVVYSFWIEPLGEAPPEEWSASPEWSKAAGQLQRP